MENSKDKIIEMIRRNNPQGLSEASLEQALMKHALNPMKMKRLRQSIIEGKRVMGISKDFKEGQIINSYGILEERREEYTHVQVLSDGTPVSSNGFTKCQTCGAVVSVESIRRCPCGQTCCISKNCGFYSKRKDEWYCSRRHASLSFLKINPRWF